MTLALGSLNFRYRIWSLLGG